MSNRLHHLGKAIGEGFDAIEIVDVRVARSAPGPALFEALGLIAEHLITNCPMGIAVVVGRDKMAAHRPTGSSLQH